MAPLADYLSKRGEFLVLLLVLLLSVSLMFLSGARKDAVARALNDAALTPVQSLVARGTRLTVSRAEADSLRAALARTQLTVDALQEDGARVERLARMLGFREAVSWDLVAARVIAREASRPGPGYKIDRGARDGIREGLAVMTPEGLAGKVVSLEPHSAWVRPLDAPSCRVSVRLERSRVDGILDWTPGKGLHLAFVPLRAEAALGDVVVTSGLGGTFPAGIRIGEVSGLEPDPSQGSLRVLVESFVDLSALEEVFVVVGAASPAVPPAPGGE